MSDGIEWPDDWQEAQNGRGERGESLIWPCDLGTYRFMQGSFVRYVFARLGVGALCVAAGAGCGGLPASATGVLEGAEQFQIYRLEPYGEAAKPGETVFRGHVIEARAEVKDAQSKAKITDIVNRGIRRGDTQAKCFNPRHGIHAVRAGKTVDLVICYECSAVEVGENGVWSTMTTADVQSDLDAAFEAAGIPPSKE